jgi:hypothetical protein
MLASRSETGTPAKRWVIALIPSLAFVLVVPADPELPVFALVAAVGCVVEDGVVGYEKLESTPCCRVGVVDGVVVSCEGAEPGALSVR